MSELRTAPEHPYQDPQLPVEQRVADLVSRLSLEDKAGLLFHTIALMVDPSTDLEVMGMPSLESMIRDRRMTHFNLVGSPGAGREFAAWTNSVQRIASRTGWGIPITFSTDPRHSFSDNPAAAMAAGPFSQWPETLGLAAIGSEELVQQFADIARKEYLAAGIRLALHPQIDLATEPRWSRIVGTFGEDADLTSRLGAAYIRGFQGDMLGADSVSTMTKHFPGGGPQKDGEDPHFPYGREQVYPGDGFAYHLRPFLAAIEAGTSQMMPYYGMPVGTEYEEVGFGFNKSVITGLLRQELGFDGIVCTDWSIVTDSSVQGELIEARAWGVEHLAPIDRLEKVLHAGADQLGGEHCTELLIELVHSGRVSEDRIDVSVARLLREKLTLGLFDDPYVDEDQAEIVIGNEEFRSAGRVAQRASVTVLKNAVPTDASNATRPILPLASGLRVYAEGVAATAVATRGEVAANPEEADVAIIRLQAPFEPRTGGVAPYFRAGSLEFTEHDVSRLRELAERIPVIVDVYLDRPALLAPVAELAAALIVDYGASDDAVLDVLFGAAAPEGRLPFDIPRSQEAVAAQRPDVPFDTADPLFRFGDGLDLPSAPDGEGGS
ncbi:glycoside hydrolase family 3 protein [Glaciibacter flavus]|uniref:beta-glucosidase n=1 Tax=Orlajensenia flava TaxID=2565934 RepID=A0A4S4FW55_9MICO|nr:glycoside hydrolase family 3 N-terminal domain-containing protein [Glaciibacter flavus]THG34302.1 glycoside hydrolase family 3 protein [Glaciibacter flavus]